LSSTRSWVPTGFNDVLVTSIKVGVVAIATLVFKEWMDTKEWDFKACAVDGAWIAGGIFAFNIILLALASKKRG
jgi:hypothetical protein